MKKLTTEEFIERAKKIYGDKYDYCKTIYVANGEDVIITCPKHGDFKKTPSNHLHKTKPQGCPFCEKEKPRHNQLTTELFIEKSRKIHGEIYDYSKVDVTKRDEKGRVCITCPIHGDFWQSPSSHLQGRGCNECKKNKISQKLRLSLEEFIERAKKIHGNKYDYSKVKYINNSIEVVITCPKHGDFKQTPDSHISGKGCKECKREKLSQLKKTSWEELVCKMNEVHENKYAYNEETYIDTHHNIIIKCPIHGEFPQTPHAHLRGQGCPKCNGGIKYTKDVFVNKAVKVHGNKYIYDKTDLDNRNEKGMVCITCPIHGDFWQNPHSHLQGCGCNECNESHLEREISIFLGVQNIDFKRGKHFQWLGKQHVDFYLPQFNATIECQGKQHFGLGGWSKNFNFEKLKELDSRKKKLCEEHGIKLYYFSHENVDDFLGEKVYHDADELIKEIEKNKKHLLI